MKLLSYLLIFLLPFAGHSQQTSKKYWILLKDKSGTPYNIGNPSAFLSQRAIDRRTKQNISVGIQDLPVNPTYINMVRSAGVTVHFASKWFNALIIETNDTNKYKAVLALSCVKSGHDVKRPGRNTGPSNSEPTLPYNRIPQNRIGGANKYNYGFAYNQIHMMNGEFLHNLGFDGKGMQIALLDGGFYHVDQLPAFDSIRMNNQILGTYDFVDHETSVYEDHEHGMEVLSTIGGNIPGQLVGTAPQASFWLYRTEDVYTEYEIEECNWAIAAERADSAGVDIISTSLGYTTFDSLDHKVNPYSHKYSDMDGNTSICTRAADYAASKGILVVASAGNSGGNSWYYIGAPADGDSVLTVGAVRSSRLFAGFSSRGPSADGRVKPNVSAQGANSTVQGAGGSVDSASGTSFSCPIMAGMAASFWQAFPNMTNMQIYHAIEKCSNNYSSPSSDSTGYGIPDFMKAFLTITGLKLAQHEGDLSVFPNPASGNFNIAFFDSGSQNSVLQVFNNMGQLKFEKRGGFLQGRNLVMIPDGILEKGMYLIKYESDQMNEIRKVVKY